SRLDGHKTVDAFVVGQGPACSAEVGVDRGGMLIFRMPVSAGRIRLPNLDQGVRDGTSVAVEHTSCNNNALAERFACMLDRKVIVVFTNLLVTVNWSGDFRQGVRQ